MHPRVAVPLVALPVLGRIVRSPGPANPDPSDAQLPFFVLHSLVESLLVGIGIALFAFGLPVSRRAAGRVGLKPWPVYLPVAWQPATGALPIASGS